MTFPETFPVYAPPSHFQEMPPSAPIMPLLLISKKCPSGPQFPEIAPAHFHTWPPPLVNSLSQVSKVSNVSNLLEISFQNVSVFLFVVSN